MDDDVRRELDALRTRVSQLEAELAVLRDRPGPPLPPDRDPFHRPEPPPGGYPVRMDGGDAAV